MADDLLGIVDSFRWRKSPTEPSTLPAYRLFQTDPEGERFVSSGDEVSGIYGLLLHLMSVHCLSEIKRTRRLGNPGLCLTPTPYSAWQGSAELGLRDQFDRCLLVDVSACAHLWGPGRAAPSSTVAGWSGGGIEFWTPDPIPWSYVRQVFECNPSRPHRRIEV